MTQLLEVLAQWLYYYITPKNQLIHLQQAAV
jgi:hypothetical protein